MNNNATGYKVDEYGQIIRYGFGSPNAVAPIISDDELMYAYASIRAEVNNLEKSSENSFSKSYNIIEQNLQTFVGTDINSVFKTNAANIIYSARNVLSNYHSAKK